MMLQQQQQQQQAQQQQQQQQRQSQEDKLVSKARDLINGTENVANRPPGERVIVPLREKWNLTLKEGAQRLYANGVLDSGGNLPNAAVASQQGRTCAYPSIFKYQTDVSRISTI